MDNAKNEHKQGEAHPVAYASIKEFAECEVQCLKAP